MKRGVLVGLVVAGCKATSPAPEPGDIVVPKMNLDAGAVDGTAAPPVVTGAKGWLLDGEQRQPQSTERAVVLAAMKKAPERAVVVHEQSIEECSGAGGTHALFTRTPSGTLHFGGHGIMLQTAFDKGSFWVAAYAPIAPPTTIKMDAFCVPDRLIDGTVLAMVPVADRDEGNRVLEDLAR